MRRRLLLLLKGQVEMQPSLVNDRTSSPLLSFACSTVSNSRGIATASQRRAAVGGVGGSTCTAYTAAGFNSAIPPLNAEPSGPGATFRLFGLGLGSGIRSLATKKNKGPAHYAIFTPEKVGGPPPGC